MLQSHNLLDRLDFGVVHERLSSRLPYVEKLSSKREDSVVVSPDDSESRNGERFGGISFGENERTFRSRSTTCVVGVFQLDESSDTTNKVESECENRKRKENEPRSFRSVGLLHHLILLELGPIEDVVDDTGFRDCRTERIVSSENRKSERSDEPFLRNSGVSSHLLPNFFAPRVMFSFVCESKAGFSTKQLTKTQR